MREVLEILREEKGKITMTAMIVMNRITLIYILYVYDYSIRDKLWILLVLVYIAGITCIGMPWVPTDFGTLFMLVYIDSKLQEI